MQDWKWVLKDWVLKDPIKDIKYREALYLRLDAAEFTFADDYPPRNPNGRGIIRNNEYELKEFPYVGYCFNEINAWRPNSPETRDLRTVTYEELMDALEQVIKNRVI